MSLEFCLELSSLTLCMLGIFPCFFCQQIFFNVSKYSFRNNIRVSKLGPTFCSKLFAKVISRRVKNRDYVISPQSNSLAAIIYTCIFAI